MKLDEKNLFIVFSPAGDENIASSRIRIYSMLHALEIRKIRYSTQISLKNFVISNVLFIQKRLSYKILFITILAKIAGKTIIYDVDDIGPALWWWAKKRLFNQIIAVADIITTGSESQKKILRNEYPNYHIVVLPPIIDYYPIGPVKNENVPDDYLRIIWFGNFDNLQTVEKYIGILSTRPFGKIVIVTNIQYIDAYIQKYPFIEFKPWSLASFLNILRSCHLSVLTHDGSEYERVKTNNKMITSINWGVPAIVSKTIEYEKTAKQAGVEYAVFSNSHELVQAVETLRSAKTRNTYLNQAQPIIWREYSPNSVTEIFLRICIETNPQKILQRIRLIFSSLLQLQIFNHTNKQ